MSRYFISLFFALFAGLASATTVSMLGDSGNLSSRIGTQVSFLDIPISSLKLAYQVDLTASSSAYLAGKTVQPPSSVAPILSNFSLTISSHITPSYTYDVFGASIQDFLNGGLYCPSHVCGTLPYIGGTGASYNEVAVYYFGGGTFSGACLTATPYRTYDGGFYQLEVKCRYGTAWRIFYANVGTVSCSPGYDFNALSGQCDLTSAVLAQAEGGDNVCAVVPGGDYSDFDCRSLISSNVLSVSSSSDSGIVFTTYTTDGAWISALKSGSDFLVSRVSASSDGGTVRYDTTISSSGIVGATNITHYPASPPPAYPGDTGGTTLPGGTSGGTTTTVEQCGSTGQPACVFDVSAITSGTTTTNTILSEMNNRISSLSAGQCGGVGQPSCKIDDFGITTSLGSLSTQMSSVASAISAIDIPAPQINLDFGEPGDSLADYSDSSPDAVSVGDELTGGLKQRLESFFTFELPAHSSACPAIDISTHAWGINYELHSNFMCDFLFDYADFFAALAMLAYFAAAIRTILSA